MLQLVQLQRQALLRSVGHHPFDGMIDSLADILLQALHDVRSGGERADDARIELFEKWQQLGAHAIAKELGRLVGLVLAPFDIHLARIAFDHFTLELQQRTRKNDPAHQRTNRRNRSQPLDSASAKKVHQKRLGIVVGVVPGHDDGVSMLLGHTLQKGVAGFSSCLLDGELVFGGELLDISPTDIGLNPT